MRGGETKPRHVRTDKRIAMTKIRAACGATLLVVCISLAGAVARGQEQGPVRGVEESLKSENRRLKEKVGELEDAGGMMVENLAACTEENQELSRKLAALTSHGTASPRQLELIGEIRKALLAPSDLEFLAKLDEAQLQTLLDVIRDRVK
jgi:hypothetical protein